MKAKRPRSVTWLAVGVLMLTGMQWLRALLAVRDWDFLDSLSLSVPPAYFLASGLVWGVTGLLVFAGLWRGRQHAPRWLRWTSAAFTVYYWVERMALTASPLRKSGWAAAMILMIALLGAIFWILSRPASQSYFGEKNE